MQNWMRTTYTPSEMRSAALGAPVHHDPWPSSWHHVPLHHSWWTWSCKTYGLQQMPYPAQQYANADFFCPSVFDIGWIIDTCSDAMDRLTICLWTCNFILLWRPSNCHCWPCWRWCRHPLYASHNNEKEEVKRQGQVVLCYIVFCDTMMWCLQRILLLQFKQWMGTLPVMYMYIMHTW